MKENLIIEFQPIIDKKDSIKGKQNAIIYRFFLWDLDTFFNYKESKLAELCGLVKVANFYYFDDIIKQLMLYLNSPENPEKNET